jgi:hypothetical protein
MGLDFTSIPDREGAALYILHTGNTLDLERLTRLQAEIANEANHQIVLVDVNTADGEQIRAFYAIELESLPVLMIIGDDDSILYQWDSSSIPNNGSDIAYQLNQIASDS